MAARSNARAALLAATINFIPAAPVDIFRFMNLPAIVLTIRRVRGRLCHDEHQPLAPALRSRRVHSLGWRSSRSR